jgi:DNA-binding NarL/FixJ family response regulator
MKTDKLSCKIAYCRLALGEAFKNEYLTPREADVLKQIFLGKTAKSAERELNISFRTVEAYIDTLKFKLGCSSKREIIGVIIKTDLIYKLGILQEK